MMHGLSSPIGRDGDFCIAICEHGFRRGGVMRRPVRGGFAFGFRPSLQSGDEVPAAKLFYLDIVHASGWQLSTVLCNHLAVPGVEREPRDGHELAAVVFSSLSHATPPLTAYY
jgi:hypothetical protein